MLRWDSFPNRTLCNVLNEMRKINKIRNYSLLSGLIEELQILGNRMEAALYDVKDIRELHEEKKKLKKELDELEKKKDEATVSKG